jgi:hypothetical protein
MFVFFLVCQMFELNQSNKLKCQVKLNEANKIKQKKIAVSI